MSLLGPMMCVSGVDSDRRRVQRCSRGECNDFGALALSSSAGYDGDRACMNEVCEAVLVATQALDFAMLRARLSCSQRLIRSFARR